MINENKLKALLVTEASTTGLVMPSKPKIVTIDIETSPNISYTWGLWQQNVSLSQLIEASRVLCFAAKWHDKKTVEFYSEDNMSHADMIRKAWEIFDEADIVVSYNGPAFDIKHLQREFVLAGMTPPSPFTNVDLLKTARQQFKFPSNKLDYVGQVMELGQKVKHAGFDLWIRVMSGEKKAWAEMKRYNVQDVRLTEALFDYLTPWIKGLPHAGIWAGERCCAKCGGTELKHTGWHHTKLSTYAKLQCQSCGGWNRLTTVKNKTTTRQL